MTLTFVNVGYGEAILVECPDDRLPDGRFTMLIDGGSAEAAEYAGSHTGRIPAADYLRRRNIRALNLVVSTHIHEDHVCRTLIENGCVIRCVSAGDEAQLCEGLTVRVLGPNSAHVAVLADRMRQLCLASDLGAKKQMITATDSCMNHYSVILLLNYRGTRILLPGDTNCVGYSGLERELWADLFKLGHHGQKDSITPELLEWITPRHAVCCASSDRRYNSAHPAPLGLLRAHGANCWFSDCPEGEDIPPHSELTFSIGPDGAVEGAYR